MPPSEDQSPIDRVEEVTEDIIRQHFNNGQYYEKVQSGELVTRIKDRSHPERLPPGEPICTWSQIIVYYTKTGEPVAYVHQYLRPDGTIGASGRPDPKRLFLPDRTLFVRARPRQARAPRS